MSEQSPQRISLKFSELYQDAIVGYMLSDYSFFLRCKMMIKPEWFTNPFNHEIAKQAYICYDRMDSKRTPKMAEVYEILYSIHSTDPRQCDLYSNQLRKCVVTTQNVGLDLLCTSMTGWIRLIKLRHSMVEAEQLYNKGDLDKAVDWLKTRMQEIEQSSFIKDESHDFSDPIEFYKERAHQFDKCLTIGHPDFDELLIKGSKVKVGYDPRNLATQTKGGLAPGDTTILLGATNSGKTSTVITIIAANLIMGKKILYITHEQKREDIVNRLYQSLTGLGGTDLSTLETNPANKTKALGASELLKNLTYISYNKPGEMYVENVVGLIKIRQEELIAKTGAGYDMLIDDFPGKLKSQHYAFKKSAGWEEQVYVYDAFVNAAEYYRFHAILPVQANREGFKVNRGDGNRMLDAGDVAQAYGIMTIASNVITLNRSIDDASRNVTKFFIAKCRSAEPNHGFISATDFNVCRTHGFGLHGCIITPDKITQADVLSKDLAEKIGREKYAKQEEMSELAIMNAATQVSTPLPTQLVTTPPEAAAVLDLLTPAAPPTLSGYDALGIPGKKT